MRRKDREVTDINEILKIVDKAKILRLGLFDNEYPYIVPLHYGYEYKEGKLIFYMHAAKEGHKLNLINKKSNVCIELDCDVKLITGGDIACDYSAAYASVIGKGNAEIVKDEKEKIKGLKLLMKNQTGREFVIDEKMASAVEVLKVIIHTFTAKSRIR